MRKILIAAMLLASGQFAMAKDEPRSSTVDPLNSSNWEYQQSEVLGDPQNVLFDDRVIVRAPASAEDSFNVPVLVDATAIPNVKKMVLLVDFGPIPKILTYWPKEAEPKLSFRFKIDQATPVRAAVETHDGRWFVGSTYIDAGGGGCTAPAHAYASSDWSDRLGEVNGLIWPDTGRVRMVVDHPMDTGLADGIPVFIVEQLSLDDMNGKQMAKIDLHEPVNEDPAFTVYFPKGKLGDALRLSGRDNNGNEIDAVLRPRLTQ